MRLISWDNLPEKMKNDSVKKYYDMLSKKKHALFLKRVFDFVAGIIMLAVLSPLFLVLGAAIKIDSAGPVFFRQTRVTQYGREFMIYKFRTMKADAGKKGFQMATERDDRITRLGRILRKSRLDEFPQLINIIKGEMSFVGTRPEVKKFVEEYTDEMLATLLLPAGTTSLASIRYMEEDKIIAQAEDANRFYKEVILPEKMKHNQKSVEEFSLLNDLKTIAATVLVVWGRKSAGKYLETGAENKKGRRSIVWR